ncbi:primosomal replication protein N [Pseudothauera nasutitermitis]|uniref:primosomal replication protein N n=1 Tax=Pseudothauera nasutitermitis TaxID=2565930 RepID=UPI001E33B0EF|nr:primosomal replication protein N [Pseudothauera nasutitermitis]
MLAELQPLRRTPAGVPVLNCVLAHESEQIEADRPRAVSVELQAVAVGELAGMLAAAAPGMRIRATGFMAAKSLRSRAPVMHLNKIEFLEGN